MKTLERCSMNRERTCGSEIAEELANEIKLKFPKKKVHDIARALGADVVYEKPVEMYPLKRISEYRPKNSQIVVFYREYERMAVAHELFHHLVKIRKIEVPGHEQEKQAEIFSNLI